MKWESLYLVLILGLVLAPANNRLYPSANGNDLYPCWYGTHVLFHGGDSYGRQVTEESERLNYGHVLLAKLRSSGVAEGVSCGGWIVVQHAAALAHGLSAAGVSVCVLYNSGGLGHKLPASN
ncbi:MAG TPA: hypothetical protein VJ756_02515 [Terriglobales bacterium]|nr:hypothetical protein [Terriglobales bacterium]